MADAETSQTTTLSKVDVLMHPVRMRIMVALAGQHLTAQQLMTRLPGVPQATLYRHLAILTQQQVLKVVEERAVRGTVEKVYAMNGTNALLRPEDLAGMSSEEHLSTFMIFLVSLLDEFQRYVASEGADFVADGAGYRATPFFLSDKEYQSAAAEMNAVLEPYLENSPSAERRRRLFATIVIPDPSQSDAEKEENTRKET